MNESPSQLEDTLARIADAKADYEALADESDKFLHDYYQSMMKGFDDESRAFILDIRHPKESIVQGRPAVLVTKVFESLRTALDYMTYQLSVLNEPELSKRVPQFVIADSQARFKKSAQTQLKYLTAE